MKDGTNTDMLRGAVSKLGSGDFRMGKPSICNGMESLPESIGQGRQTRGTETSKYPEEEKANAIPSVAASERGTAQTGRLASRGCRTLHMELQRNEVGEQVWKGWSEKVKTL